MFLVGHRKRVRLNHTAFRRLCFSTLQLVIDITLDSYLLVIAGGAGNCALHIRNYLFNSYSMWIGFGGYLSRNATLENTDAERLYDRDGLACHVRPMAYRLR